MTHAARRISGLLLSGLLIGLSAGCESSAWQRNLSRGPEAAASLPESSDVRIRQVPWERVEETLRSIRAEVAASDLHPDEWPEERKQAQKATLLRGLQISEPAERVRVVGSSEFRTTSNPGDDESLRRVARSLGADTVVWSSRWLGKADKVVQEPVSGWTTGTVWARDADGTLRPRSQNEHTTTWVPVVVRADESGYMAFFLRTRD